MRHLDAVLQDASAVLGQVGALLERCRALRLELDADRTPAPDVTTQAERAVYVGMLSALERGLIRALEAMLAFWDAAPPEVGGAGFNILNNTRPARAVRAGSRDLSARPRHLR